MEEREKKRPTSVLCVAVLEVAHSDQELLDGDRLLVREEVPLSGELRVVHQNVGVSCDAGNSAPGKMAEL